jgi:hypothetical protein
MTKADQTVTRRLARRGGAVGEDTVRLRSTTFQPQAPIIACSQVRAPPLERPVRIRHVAVRILATQPATGVSSWGFRVLTEVPTFPQVGGRESGLWSGILTDSPRRPRIPRRVSARRFFNIRNLDREPSRDWLRFRGDRFEIDPPRNVEQFRPATMSRTLKNQACPPAERRCPL